MEFIYIAGIGGAGAFYLFAYFAIYSSHIQSVWKSFQIIQRAETDWKRKQINSEYSVI